MYKTFNWGIDYITSVYKRKTKGTSIVSKRLLGPHGSTWRLRLERTGKHHIVEEVASCVITPSTVDKWQCLLDFTGLRGLSDCDDPTCRLLRFKGNVLRTAIGLGSNIIHPWGFSREWWVGLRCLRRQHLWRSESLKGLSQR